MQIAVAWRNSADSLPALFSNMIAYWCYISCERWNVELSKWWLLFKCYRAARYNLKKAWIYIVDDLPLTENLSLPTPPQWWMGCEGGGILGIPQNLPLGWIYIVHVYLRRICWWNISATLIIWTPLSTGLNSPDNFSAYFSHQIFDAYPLDNTCQAFIQDFRQGEAIATIVELRGGKDHNSTSALLWTCLWKHPSVAYQEVYLLHNYICTVYAKYSTHVHVRNYMYPLEGKKPILTQRYSVFNAMG